MRDFFFQPRQHEGKWITNLKQWWHKYYFKYHLRQVKKIYIYNNDVPKDIFRVTFNNRNGNSNNSNICFPFCTLNCPKDKISFKFLTTTIENHICTHCTNGQPEQEQEERNCKTKHDSKLFTFACVPV